MYQVTAVFDAIDNISRTAANIGGNVEGLGSRVQNAGRAMMSAGAKMTAGVTAPIVGIGIAAAKAAIDVESAFAGVIKTTDGLIDETGNLTQAGETLKQGFRDLAKEVPMAVEELMAIGEIGGQLGIGRDQLIDFTRTIAALGVSTNLSTEEAAQALARIGNIFNVETDKMGENVERLGSTIVALGNNFATSEAEITNFALRIAGAGQIAGLTQSDILAIGAAMSSVGVQAEAGGTAVQKVLIAMNTAVSGTGKAFVDNTAAIGGMEQKLMSLNANLVRYEAQTGVTAGEMRAMYQEFRNAGGTLEEFGRTLGDSGRQKLFETVLAIDATREAMAALQAEQGKPIDAGNLTTFAKIAGMTAEEFKAAWEDDAAGAFQKFVEGLGKEGDNAVNVLSELGLQDQRLVRSFLSLANAGDLLGETIGMATEAWDENSALTKEAGQRYATVESQLAIVKNVFKDLLVTLGERFLPIIRDVIEGAKGVAAWISNLPEPVVNTALAIAGLAAAAGPVLMILGALTTALGALLSPVGLVVAAIAGLALAFATNFMGIRDAVQPVIDWLVEAWDKIVEAVGPALTVLKGAAGDIVAAFQEGGLPAAIEAFKALWPDISGAIKLGLQRAAEAVGPMLAEVGQKLAEGASRLGGQLVGALSDALGVDLGSVFGGLSDALGPVVEAVGGAIGDIVGAFREGGLTGAIDEFKALWPGLKDAIGEGLGKAADAVGPALGEIGGKLLEAGGKLGTKLLEGLGDVLGVDLFAVFDEVGTNISTAFETISSTVSTVWEPIKAIFTSIGEVLGPSVGGAFESLKGAFEGIAPLGESLKNLFEQLWPVLQTVAAVIAGVVVGAIGLLTGVISGLVEGISAAVPYIIGAVTGAVDIIAGAIGVVVDAVKLLVAWIQGDSEKIAEIWESLKENAATIWEGIKTLVVNAVMGLVELVTGFIGGLVEGIVGFFTGLYEKLVGGSIIPEMIEAIIAWFQALLEPVKAVWEGIKTATAVVWAAIKAAVQAGIAVIEGVITTAMGALQGVVSGAWDAIKGATETVWAAIQSAIQTAVDTITGVLDTIASTVVPAVKGAWDDIKEAASTAWDKISDVVGDAVDDVLDFVEGGVSDWLGAWETFKGDVEALWGKISGAITGVVKTLKEDVGKIWDDIKSKITGAIDKVLEKVGAFTDPLSVLKGLFEGVQGVAETFKGALDKLKTTFNNIKDALGELLQKLRDFLAALADAIIPDWLQGHSPSPMENWLMGIAGALKSSAAAADDWGASFQMATKNVEFERFDAFSQSLQSLLDVLSRVRRYISGALSLSSFESDLMALVDVVVEAHNRMMQGAWREEESPLEGMIGMLSETIGALGALREYARVEVGNIQAFADDLQLIIQTLGEMAQDVSSELLFMKGMMSHLSTMLGALQAAIEALGALREYSGAGVEAVEAFAGDLRDVVQLMGDLAQEFSEDGVEAATQFAVSAGIIGETAGQAAAGMEIMANYGGIAVGALEAFAADLPAVVGAMVDIAREFEQDAVEAAEVFSQSAGAIAKEVGSAVEGFVVLAEYGGISVEALEAFEADLPKVLTMMVDIARKFEQDGVEAAALFADSAGKIGGAVGRAVRGITDLAEYGGVTKDVVKGFRDDLVMVVQVMEKAMADLADVDLEAMAGMLDQLKGISDAVYSMLRALSNLAEYEGGIGSGLEAFISDLELLIQAFEELRDAIPEWLVPGSPTPFELGLKGITSALGQMQGALPDTSGLFAIPAPEALFGGLAAPAGGAGDGARSETHYHLEYHGYTKDDPGERDAARVLNELAILTRDRR